MTPRRARLLPVVAGAALLVAGCTDTSPPTESPSAATATTAVTAPVTTMGAAATPALATPVPALDAVAFLRAQQTACAQHAASTGNPVVEPDRFAGATQVRDLGGGAFVVQDGRGTRLVVEPGTRMVLPESGDADDAMPPPYGGGCPEDVFTGAADG